MWLTLFFGSLQVKCNLSFVFKALRRGVIGSSHIVSFFPSKLSKLNIRVQKVHSKSLWCKKCIRKVYGAKCNMRYSLIW